jgi:hypothetical protein
MHTALCTAARTVVAEQSPGKEVAGKGVLEESERLCSHKRRCRLGSGNGNWNQVQNRPLKRTGDEERHPHGLRIPSSGTVWYSLVQ